MTLAIFAGSRRVRALQLNGYQLFSRYIHKEGEQVLHISGATVFRQGDADVSRALLRNVQWSIEEGESWAVVGSKKSHLLETLLGHHRVYPAPPKGIFPFLISLNPPRDIYNAVSIVSFATRLRSSGGAFYDFTARYGALRDEERITLRESLLSGHTKNGAPIGSPAVEEMSEHLQLRGLLDIPLIALSNGQIRRARILRELLERPKVLVLDEPLTGLDVQQRPILTHLLQELHSKRQPRCILGLRPHDPLPEWITHLAVVKDRSVMTGTKEDMIPQIQSLLNHAVPDQAKHRRPIKSHESGKELISMKNVKVGYHGRKVLDDINWTIREGDRWHLQGPNGSGKTTLLSVLTGDHPQSYIQAHFHLFGKPRKSISTVDIQRKIGFVSPELFNAFPRRSLTVRDAIATGFESTFSYRPRTKEQDHAIDRILSYFSEVLGERNVDTTLFASLPSGEQSLVLLFRALISKPPLVILDEVFAGMDEKMVGLSKEYIRNQLGENQAAVFVTHWKEEVPWGEDVVKTMSLTSQKP